VCTVTLDLTCNQVTSDDTTCLTILNNDIEHLVTSVRLYRAVVNLLVKRCISTEEQLLTGLATSIECTRYLSTTE
jgi:hypothetical protein